MAKKPAGGPPGAPGGPPDRKGGKGKAGKGGELGGGKKQKLILLGVGGAAIVGLALISRSKNGGSSSTGTPADTVALPVTGGGGTSDDFDSLESQLNLLQQEISAGQHGHTTPQPIGHHPAKHPGKSKKPRRLPGGLNPGGRDRHPKPKRTRRKPRRNPGGNLHVPKRRGKKPTRNPGGTIHTHRTPPRRRK